MDYYSVVQLVIGRDEEPRAEQKVVDVNLEDRLAHHLVYAARFLYRLKHSLAVEVVHQAHDVRHLR